jgi:hypothetical protein
MFIFLIGLQNKSALLTMDFDVADLEIIQILGRLRATRTRHDFPGVRRSDEALLLFLKVPGVGKRQCSARLFEYFQDVL